MKTVLLRWLPGLLSLVILTLALLAPARGVKARGVPETDAVFDPSCSLVVEEGTGSASTYTVSAISGISQPLDIVSNVAACSLHVDYVPVTGYSIGRFDLRVWDPAALAPTANIVSLRTRYFTSSDLLYTRVMSYYDPPLVLREVPGLAESMGPHFAIDYTVTQSNSQTFHYDADGPGYLPAALSFTSSPFIPRAPLPGNHPVLTHRVCGGNATLQGLYNVQSVLETSSTQGGAALYEIAQRFRVPVATELRWVEFVMTGGATDQAWNYGEMGIFDATGESAPPMTWGSPLVSANFYALNVTVPLWQSHFDFDHTVTLQPEHDYWLMFRPIGSYNFGVKDLDGTEGPLFQERIGPFFKRYASTQIFAALPTQALNFRIVGQPSGTVAVGPPAPSRAGLALAVTPSPARGPVTVAWSGARGALRFEVLDPRGRRVASGDAAAAPSGRWTWVAAGDDGRALAAGVYFVRARDVDGRTASARMVLVR